MLDLEEELAAILTSLEASRIELLRSSKQDIADIERLQNGEE